MTLREAIYYTAVCDLCGREDDAEYSAWSRPDSADESADDADWHVEGGNHICDNCEPRPLDILDDDEVDPGAWRRGAQVLRSNRSERVSTSMARLLAHLAGDYLCQTDWMANEKTSRSLPALAHALSYTACFLPLTRDWRRLAIIGGTHFVIDRWRLAKHVAWAKNQVAPKAYRPPHTATGYSDERPPWLTFWLLIITDNWCHLALNELALYERTK